MRTLLPWATLRTRADHSSSGSNDFAVGLKSSTPATVALGAIRRHSLGGKEDHRPPSRSSARSFFKAVAVQPRHHYIADNHIRQHLQRALLNGFRRDGHTRGHIEASSSSR